MMPSVSDVPQIATTHIVTASPTTTHRTRVRPTVAWLVWAAVVCGCIMRIGVFVRNPSLWIDEAMLALNVIHRSPMQLTQPLDLNQGAPLGFLLASKLVITAFGPSEYSLRAVSMFAAVVGLLLFTSLAYRLLALRAARIAVMLAAISPYLTGYAAEFKQYELDATITITLLWLGRGVWDGTATRRDQVALAVGGAVAVWCSHPAVFVLGGVGVAMVLNSSRRSTFVVIGVWILSFTACYLLFLRKLGANPYLLDYWAGKFLPLPPIRPGDWAWLVDHFFALFDKPGGMNGGFGLAGIAGVSFLIGCLSLAQTQRTIVIVCVVPLLLALLASGLRKYPFAGRLMLFCVPLLLLMVAAGLSVMFDRLRTVGGGAHWVFLGAAFVGSVAECNELRKRPLHAEDAREIVALASSQYQPGDKVYVFYGAVPTFAYYHARYPFPSEQVRFGLENRGKSIETFRKELDAFRGESRVWIVMAHFQETEETAMLTYLDSCGHGKTIARRADARLLLYELRK